MSEICPKCGLPKELCVCEEIAREQQRVEIKIDKRRYGKMMTIIEGLNPSDTDLKSLVSKLKAICASGGTVKDGKIELQGDHRNKVKEYLEGMGYIVEVI
ncbi:MAG: stress response translation initiation inhibitor YciH [Thermoplasmata archaeon]|nr:MAG: stress response translation initiation inhibitor YciH [Thermoplasmata archaeon]RLF46000.1 MAG: stress response translation initiation inhibitor YciH [Thermoplasmata archaeon]HDD56933.1 stress response translation initiation inhibitor YciH [Thermoplasmatales archaeon]HEB37064.1 stress response translation initiation inhibitor YciH [Thermoplasmatales archaeon]